MSSLLVTYDLSRPGQEYEDLLKKLKALGGWAKLSESSYAIQTTYTPQQVFDHLKSSLDRNDNLYVIHLKRPYSGRGPKEVNDWLEQNLDY